MACEDLELQASRFRHELLIKAQVGSLISSQAGSLIPLFSGDLGVPRYKLASCLGPVWDDLNLSSSTTGPPKVQTF